MEEIELNNDELRSATVSKLDGDPKIGWLCNKNGLLLKTYEWLAHNAIGIILLIHGLKAHTRLTFMRINIKMSNNNEGIIVDSDNYYIYKDSWIEKFNQNGYSVYALDLQGHGESQAWKNTRGDFSSFDDLVDDVIQYMYQIQNEISNDNQTNDIVTTKKKKLPMYIIGHSVGGNIAIRILQLLREKKEGNINAGDENYYKKCNIMLDDLTNANEINNDTVEDMIDDMNNFNDSPVKDIWYKRCISNSNNDDPYIYIANTSDKDERFYNNLYKLNIKGCVSLSGMMKLNAIRKAGDRSIRYLYLPLAKFLSRVAPNAVFSPKSGLKHSEYVADIYKYDKFRNSDKIKFKCISELIKATVTLNCNINHMPTDIPLLFVHSKDDNVCCFEAAYSFYNKANVPGKKFHTVDGMNHAITAAPGNEEILNEILNWISNLRRKNEEQEYEIKDVIKDEAEDIIKDETEGIIKDETEDIIKDENESEIQNVF
ncbi:lysophospholipase, putative [Plasmodium chabaudi chabaudi]|uniref:Lysophospholipase, putative n=1 Tax=Plasmodium chabaudi chabaudi TaxID=31271 RepID=A0A4V0K259_PLACU|nr:lysophospholipase, putative [Plasmodium chabaudi chabaudi]VTZ66344.1 lysophospholipase, putative [Plasmodium chabaudi chabaudi]|eukprot:XP_016655472.1 lysophospholipase, putative [Plasmodium chabaudi chabaudi]